MSRPDTLCALFQRAEQVTYPEAGAALGLDPWQDRKAITEAMRAAGRKILARTGRALIAVPNVGYRLAEANEHVTLYRERKQRGTTQIGRGVDILAGTDLTGLSPEARDAVLAEAVAGRRIVDFIIATDRRQARTEEAVEAIKGTVNRTAEETARLRADLERLQQSSPPVGQEQ